ncbi:MAG: hypothetical protein PVI40_07540 [Chlamydiota bacterium]
MNNNKMSQETISFYVLHEPTLSLFSYEEQEEIILMTDKIAKIQNKSFILALSDIVFELSVTLGRKSS